MRTMCLIWRITHLNAASKKLHLEAIITILMIANRNQRILWNLFCKFFQITLLGLLSSYKKSNIVELPN